MEVLGLLGTVVSSKGSELWTPCNSYISLYDNLNRYMFDLVELEGLFRLPYIKGAGCSSSREPCCYLL